MEVASLKHRSALRGPTAFLRLQGDERLVALTRRGNQSAYEVLVARYQTRLLAFCRHMLASREDAEDVLQEVFAAAFNAMVADDRPINVRPWLYRIARNRSLNHLRKQTAIGVDSMDVHLSDHGASTADRVHDREQFRELVGDVQGLPETQRTALLLREIDALSYEQIAQAMETTVPAIKSLLVRARVGLAEAAEARALTCEEVRDELGEVAEGLRRKSAPVRRHVRGCKRCGSFERQLGHTSRALAALFPVGPLLLVKNFLLAQGAGSAAASAAAGGAAAAGAGGTVAGGALSAGVATFASKAVAVVAGAAIVTAGAVEVDHSRQGRGASASAIAAGPAPSVAAPRVVATLPQPAAASGVLVAPQTADERSKAKARLVAADAEAAATRGAVPTPIEVAPVPVAAVVTDAAPPLAVVDSGSDVSVMPTPADATSTVTIISPPPGAAAAPATAPPVPEPPPAASGPAAAAEPAPPAPAPHPAPAPQPASEPTPGTSPVPAATPSPPAEAPTGPTGP